MVVDHPMTTVTVIHTLDGRARLRIPAMKRDHDIANSVQTFLQHQCGIHDVRMNEACASLTVTYDPSVWDSARLSTVLRSYVPRRPRPKPCIDADTVLEESSAAEASGLRFWVSTAGTVLAFVAEPLAAPILPALLLFSAWPVVQKAYDSLVRQRQLNLDVLDATVLTLLSIRGQVQTATVVLWINTLADYLRELTKRGSTEAVTALLTTLQDHAWVVRDGQRLRVSARELQPGATIVVYTGERIPADGTVIRGNAIVVVFDAGGAVEKGTGDAVCAGMLIKEGKLYVRVERVGGETETAATLRLMRTVSAGETQIQKAAVEWANELVPYSYLGAATAAVITGDLDQATAALMIDYGTAMQVSAPTAVLSAMGTAARRGIVVKSGRFLEVFAAVDALVFNISGTLTSGRIEIVHVRAYGSCREREILMWAAAAEQRLSHPLATAIVATAQAKGITIPDRTASDYSLGLGVEATAQGHHILVGTVEFFNQHGLMLSRDVREDIVAFERQPLSLVIVALDRQIIGLFWYRDPLRPEAFAVMEALRQRGIRAIALVTGEREHIATIIAEQLGCERLVAQAMPQEKATLVRRLQKEGYKVAMVGRGAADVPALIAADVAVAVEGASDAARGLAHFVYHHGGLWQVPLSLDLSRKAIQLIQEDWNMVVVCNTLALGLTAVGLLDPFGASIVNDGSTLLTTANSLRPLLGMGGGRRSS